MTAPVDWTAFRKCPVCAAAIGSPCVRRTEVRHQVHRLTPADQPHRSRKPRTGGAR